MYLYKDGFRVLVPPGHFGLGVVHLVPIYPTPPLKTALEGALTWSSSYGGQRVHSPFGLQFLGLAGRRFCRLV